MKVGGGRDKEERREERERRNAANPTIKGIEKKKHNKSGAPIPIQSLLLYFVNFFPLSKAN